MNYSQVPPLPPSPSLISYYAKSDIPRTPEVIFNDKARELMTNLKNLGLNTSDKDILYKNILSMATRTPPSLNTIIDLKKTYNELLTIKLSGAIDISSHLNDKTNVIIMDCERYFKSIDDALKKVIDAIALTLPPSSAIRSGLGHK
jgi:hypothetical protein